MSGELESKFIIPTKKRIAKRPVAVIECPQEIPCNPCVLSCPQNAIIIKNGINGIPEIDFELCTGCSLCVPKCPGLAIFVIGIEKEDKNKGIITLPYEFHPIPQIGDVVDALDREGGFITKATIKKVFNTQVTDRTSVITISVPSEYIHEIRFIRAEKITDIKEAMTRR